MHRHSYVKCTSRGPEACAVVIRPVAGSHVGRTSEPSDDERDAALGCSECQACNSNCWSSGCGNIMRNRSSEGRLRWVRASFTFRTRCPSGPAVERTDPAHPHTPSACRLQHLQSNNPRSAQQISWRDRCNTFFCFMISMSSLAQRLLACFYVRTHEAVHMLWWYNVSRWQMQLPASSAHCVCWLGENLHMRASLSSHGSAPRCKARTNGRCKRSACWSRLTASHAYISREWYTTSNRPEASRSAYITNFFVNNPQLTLPGRSDISLPVLEQSLAVAHPVQNMVHARTCGASHINTMGGGGSSTGGTRAHRLI